MVRVTVMLTPAFEAVMVVEPVVVTGNVGTAKVVLTAPAGIVTLPGTVARVTTELVRVTTVPPAGAAALRVTVPVDAAPPTTLVGATEKAERFAADAGATAKTMVRTAPRSSRIKARFMGLAPIAVVPESGPNRPLLEAIRDIWRPCKR